MMQRLRDFGASTSARTLLAVAAISAALSSSLLPAQQRPTLGYAYPPGGKPGQSVEVQLGGYDFTADMDVFVHDQRAKIDLLSPPGPLLYPGAPYWFGPRALNSYKPFSIPREIRARIAIPADAKPGVVRWQVANANGGSGLAEFVISDGARELLEDDLTSSGDATELPFSLPLILNGRLEKKEEVDKYQFTASHTGLVTIEASRAKIGAPIDAAMRVIDQETRQTVADYVDTAGRGAAITFKVVAGRRYTLCFHDLDFRGNRAMIYRLSWRTGPRVVAMLPTRVAPNSQTDVTFVGYGIATGNPQLETVQQTVHSKSAHFDYLLKTEHGAASPFPVIVSDVVESVHRGDARELSLPACVSRVFDDSQQYHQYSFQAQQGDTWSIDLTTPNPHRTLDLAYFVVNDAGKVVAQSDDTADSLDARGTVRVPADGEYQLFVSNQSSNSHGPDAIYRLCVRAPQPSFQWTLPPTVETFVGARPIVPPKRRRAGRQQVGALGIDIVRVDGFAGEISIELELPPGFHAPDEIKIAPKQTGVDIPISCDAEQTPDAKTILVRATASLADDAAPDAASPDPPLLVKQQSLLLCPMLEPRSLVRPKYPDAARTVNRGATYPAPVVVERLLGFEGPVELQMAAIPDRVRQGILGHSQTIGAGDTEGVFPLVIPEWVQTDRTSRITLNSIVTWPDAAGRPRTLVNRMERRITMNVEGALLKVDTPSERRHWTNESLILPIELFRSGELKGPVTVTLHASGVDRPLAKIVADESAASAQLTLSSKPSPGVYACTLRASARQDIYPVVSESKLTIVVPPLQGK